MCVCVEGGGVPDGVVLSRLPCTERAVNSSTSSTFIMAGVQRASHTQTGDGKSYFSTPFLGLFQVDLR